MKPLYLGVDAGGSKTQAAVLRGQEELLSLVAGPGANFQDVGLKEAGLRLRKLCQAALREAGVRGSQIQSACFGMAGADRPQDVRTLKALLRRISPVKRFHMVVDTQLVLRLGSPSCAGIAVIVGTGANSLGVNGRGQSLSVGGWMNQSVGGGNLGRAAVKAAIESFDGRGRKSRLERALCKHFKLRRLADLLELGYFDQPQARRLRPAALAPLVFQAAAEGDRVARQLLQEQGRELAKMASVIVRRLFASQRQVTICLGGSLLQRAEPPLIVQSFKRELARGFRSKQFQFTVPAQAPVFGALAYAQDVPQGG